MITKQTEQKLQSKVIKFLNQEGFYCIKLISSNTRGVPDLICLKKGKFIAIELKKDKYSKEHNFTILQEYNANKIKEHGGYSFVVYDLDTLKEELKKLNLLDIV